MAKILLSWINHIKASETILSASGANGNMPVTNIADPRPGKRWRCGVSDWARADFGANIDIDLLALRYPRDAALPGGTVRHQIDADGGTPGAGAVADSGLVSIGLISGYGYHVWRPESSVSARLWQFTYAATGVSVVDTGIAWAGEIWSPDINIDLGHGDMWRDLSKGTQAERSGSMFWDERPRQRVISFSLGNIRPSERETVREMQRIAGISRQVLAIIDPDDAPRETIIGTLTESSPIRHPQHDTYSKVFEIQESL